MAKALEVNENSVGGKPAKMPPSRKRPGAGNDHEIQGKSLEVNANSVGDEKRAQKKR